MRFVYLAWTPYSQRFHDQYVAPLLERGQEVAVIDCTACLRASTHTKVRLPDARDYEHLHVCGTKEDIDRALGRFRPEDMVFSLIHLSKQTLFVYKLLHKHDLRFCAYLPENIPAPPELKGANDPLLKRLRKAYGSENKIRQTLCRSMRFPNRLLGVAEASLLLVSSGIVPAMQFPVGPSTRIAHVHSFDYDQYLHLRDGLGKAESLFENDGRIKALFLESASPVHPDRFWTGKRAQFTSDVYYPEIKAFLREVRDRYDLDLLVAAHPRAVWEGRLEHYAEHRMVQGKSLQAVHDADVVFTHASISAGFAVMMRKPLACLNTDQLSNQRHGLHVKYLAETLGKEAYNISRGGSGFDLEREMVVDPEAYDRYTRNHLNPKGDDRFFWDKVLDSVSALA